MERSVEVEPDRFLSISNLPSVWRWSLISLQPSFSQPHLFDHFTTAQSVSSSPVLSAWLAPPVCLTSSEPILSLPLVFPVITLCCTNDALTQFPPIVQSSVSADVECVTPFILLPAWPYRATLGYLVSPYIRYWYKVFFFNCFSPLPQGGLTGWDGCGHSWRWRHFRCILS